jgi:hypothetical protein
MGLMVRMRLMHLLRQLPGSLFESSRTPGLYIVKHSLKPEWPVGLLNGLKSKLKVCYLLRTFFADCEAYAEIFRRQLFGYSVESELYIRSRARVIGVWDELKGLGLDMRFLLEALIAHQALREMESGPSLESTVMEEGIGLGLESC